LRLLDQDGGPTLPRQPAGATSDFAGAPQELIDAGLSPEKLIEVIQRMCKATGLDPKHAVEEIMGELGVETAKGRQ